MLILLLSTLLTVVKNPPDSLLCLIATFVLTIGLLLKIGMDFVAFSFLIVYIGAVAILFLFVIILFNLNEIFVEQGLHFVVKFGIGVSAYIIIDYIANLFHIDSLSSSVGTDLTNTIINTPSILADMRDVYIFTTTFYSYYWDFFLICGWLLLVAMLGAIAIALSEEGSIDAHLGQPTSPSFTRTSAGFPLFLIGQWTTTIGIDSLFGNFINMLDVNSTAACLVLLPFATPTPGGNKKNIFQRLFYLLTYDRWNNSKYWIPILVVVRIFQLATIIYAIKNQAVCVFLLIIEFLLLIIIWIWADGPTYYAYISSVQKHAKNTDRIMLPGHVVLKCNIITVIFAISRAANFGLYSLVYKTTVSLVFGVSFAKLIVTYFKTNEVDWLLFVPILSALFIHFVIWLMDTLLLMVVRNSYLWRIMSTYFLDEHIMTLMSSGGNHHTNNSLVVAPPAKNKPDKKKCFPSRNK